MKLYKAAIRMLNLLNMNTVKRRKFIQTLTTFSAIAGLGTKSFAKEASVRNEVITNNNRFKISLNAYSFNDPLRKGITNLEAVMDFCAKENFDAIDLTAYYFPGYPKIPSDEYIFYLKRKAHQLGLAISGTGIKNDFTEPDKTKRKMEVDFVKKWIEVAAKLGAPVLRVFAGKEIPVGYTWEETANWMIEDFKTCVEYGKRFGVIVAVQNHNDFIKTGDQVIEIMKRVNSEWFGLILDTDSFATLEPYSEIRKTVEFAVNWQVKEMVKSFGKNEHMDLEKIFRIAKDSNYRGYLPIETLSSGDPFMIVPPFLQKVRTAMATVMKVN